MKKQNESSTAARFVARKKNMKKEIPRERAKRAKQKRRVGNFFYLSTEAMKRAAQSAKMVVFAGPFCYFQPCSACQFVAPHVFAAKQISRFLKTVLAIFGATITLSLKQHFAALFL